jgi:hypothetical protein
MTNEEDTVQIPAVPRPASVLWLGITAATGGAGWLVTVTAMLLNTPSSGQLVAAGLCVSVTLSLAAVTAWGRYSLTRAAAENWRQHGSTTDGQYTLLIAEIRGVRRALEQAAGHASAERQAAGVKLTKIIDEMPTYWHGVADELSRNVEGTNVRTFPHRGPRN